MTAARSVVIVGGGLAGMGAAYALAERGATDITIVERASELGGLAGSIERDGRFYPLAYHHILHRDRGLLWFLDRLSALPLVRWRKIDMLFHLGGRFYNLASPAGFARFPMSALDKLRFARLMGRAFLKRDWTDWEGRSAAELIDRWGGPGVREALFEPLTRLKFDLPCAESSGAWIGSRLHFREGASPFGYIPGHNWTQVLCHRLTRALLDRGITVRTRASVAEISYDDDRVRSVTLEDGQTLSADEFIFTIPTETTTRLLPEDRTRTLRSIRYTAILSAIVTTRQPISPRFYWLNLLERRQASTGIFMLDALNPTIGRRDDISLNFTTHLSGRDHPMYALSDEELLQRYSNDFEELFGAPLVTDWSRLVRVPMYSPIFHRDYRNPPIRSETYRNVWFAGNYLTHPSIASTGTALLSGVRTAEALIGDDREASPLSAAIVRFRLRGMKRA